MRNVLAVFTVVPPAETGSGSAASSDMRIEDGATADRDGANAEAAAGHEPDGFEEGTVGYHKKANFGRLLSRSRGPQTHWAIS